MAGLRLAVVWPRHLLRRSGVRANGGPNGATDPMTAYLRARRALGLAIALTVGAPASIAHGQVYKCTDDAGRTTYSDAPCAAASKPLKLPTDPRASATDPNVCAQLQDETQRLAAEADRSARAGRKESASSAKRRQQLTEQYEARCVGIARSVSPAK